MTQNQTETQSSLSPQQELYHHLRNTFQVIIRKFFDKPDTLSVQEIHMAIKVFVARIKNNSSDRHSPDETTQLINQFSQLLNIRNLTNLKDKFKEVYCKYDPDTCQRMANPQPQKSLI